MNDVTRRLFSIACVAAFMLSPAAWAQTKAKNVAFRSGRGSFHPTVQEGVWSQWTVRVSNDSDQSRRVKVGCLADEPDRGQTLFSRITSLPPHCVREMDLAFRPGIPSQNAPTRSGSDQRYQLWDAQTGQQLQASTGLVVYVPPKEQVVGLLLGNRIEHDESSYLRELPRRPLGNVRLATTTTTNLPDRWYGYSILKLFALGGVSPKAIRTTQRQALLEWVRGGGCLLLLGCEELPALLAGPIGEAAGVQALGVHFVDTLHGTRGRSKTQTVTLDWPLPMVELCPTDAEVLFEANGLPLLTRRKLGEGWIFTSALPAGALQPRGNFNVWPDIARTRNARPAIDPKAFLTPGRETLQKIAGRRGPDRLVPTALIAGFLAFVVVVGLGLRLLRRGEWLWILLVPMGLAVGAGLYHYSKQLGDPQRLSHIGLLTGLDGGETRVQRTFAYYSGPKAQTLTLTSGSAAGLIRDLGRTATAAMKADELRTTDTGTELPRQHIEPNGTRAFYTHTIEPFPLITGTLGFDETGLTGTLQNALPTDIENAVLLVNQHTYRVGTLRASDRNAVRVNDADLLGMVTFPLPRTSRSKSLRRSGKRAKANQAKSPTAPRPAEGEFSSAMVPDALQSQLVRHLIARPGFQRVTPQPVLIGYTTATGLDPLPGRDLQRQGWSVVVWPVSLSAPPAGRVVQIPAGLVDIRFRASIWDVRHNRFIESTRATKVALTAQPPLDLPLQNVTADLTVDLRAMDYSLTVSGVLPGPAGQTVALRTFNRPNGEVRLRIPDADRFLDEEGRLHLVLEVGKLSLELPGIPVRTPKAPAGRKKAVPTGPWQFHRVDVALKGTVR